MSKLTITGVLFEGWEILDLMGPLSVLQKLANNSSKFSSVTVELVGPSQTVRNTAALPFYTDRLFDTSKGDGEHIVLVPGGLGTLRHASDAAMLKYLKAQEGTVGSICTGSSVLAEAGLLDGKQATSNKAVFDLMATYRSSTVKYEPNARFVRDGRIWTASGVSAGIDMGFAIGVELFGEEACRQLASSLGIEPLPQGEDPYVAVHKKNWRPYWRAYIVASLFAVASRFLLEGFVTALRKPGKKLAASILLADTVDTISLAGIAECFAIFPDALGVEYVSLGSTRDVKIGDASSSDAMQRRAMKVLADRCLNGGTFVKDSKWTEPTLFIVPPMAEPPSSLGTVLKSLEGSTVPVMLCGEHVIGKAVEVLGELPKATSEGKGWKRAGKYLLVDAPLAGVSASLDEIARQAGAKAAQISAIQAEFAPELIPESVGPIPKL